MNKIEAKSRLKGKLSESGERELSANFSSLCYQFVGFCFNIMLLLQLPLEKCNDLWGKKPLDLKDWGGRET